MGRDAVRRGHGPRGATLVEYALIVSVFLFAALGAISGLDDKSGEYYDTASDDIGDLPQSGIDTSDEGTIPSTSSTSSTTSTSTPASTSTSTPSTTSSTSTTSTTTTTTTTTTTVPTTTTMPLRSTISELQDISTYDGGWTFTAIARVKIVRNTTGAAVNNATVTIQMKPALAGTVTKTCTTNSSGRCQVTYTALAVAFEAKVTNVSASPTWDGTQQTVTLSP